MVSRRERRSATESELERAMYDQLFETYRKTSESWLQMQQDMFKNVVQQWLSATPHTAGVASDWNRTFQKRWMELAVEILNKHRESIDAMYRSVIQLIEQSSRMSEAKSAEEYRRVVEEMWRKWFESVKSQSESQFRDVQNWAGKSLEIVQNAQA
jgi:hypothetical protein